MAEDLILPVPRLLTATYVVPAALEGDAAQARIIAAFEGRVAEPLPPVASKLLDAGAARLVSMDSMPPLPIDFQRYLGVPDELVSRVNSAAKSLAVSVTWTPGWPPMHEWAGRACAAALADDLGVPLVDTFIPQVLTAGKALASLPGAPPRLKLSEWVLVFQSAGDHGLWTTTKGLGRFGLPELQSRNVPPQYGNAWVKLMTGIASRLLNEWTTALRDRGDSSSARVPAVLEVGESDVAAAYSAETVGGGRVPVLLTFDPAPEDGADSFLTIQPPDDVQGSAGEYFAYACSQVFGASERVVAYVPETVAMEQAIQEALETLPAARSRFLEGSIPLRARLMIKFRLQAADGSEYPWAYVNSWKDPATVLGSAASDAIRDPAVRAGRPIAVNADTIVDWGIWIDGQGIIEGGFTNAVALSHGETSSLRRLVVVAFEDLDGVPVDVDDIDRWLTRPDRQERLAGERVDGAPCLAGRDIQRRDRDQKVRAEAEDAAVEQGMMQRAQCDCVGHVVGAVLAVPSHVRGLDGDRVAAEPAVEPAHRALVGVRAQDLLGEPRCARPASSSFPALGCLEHWQVKTDRGTDHLAEHGREVLVQQQPRRGGERGGVCEDSSHVRPELAHRAVIEQPSRSLWYIRRYLFAM